MIEAIVTLFKVLIWIGALFAFFCFVFDMQEDARAAHRNDMAERRKRRR